MRLMDLLAEVREWPTEKGRSMEPVRHRGYVFGQMNYRAYGSHSLAPGTPPGVYVCGICDRLVIRGKGAWWS